MGATSIGQRGCGTAPIHKNGHMLSANDIAPGLYRHYKGNLYEVVGVAHHSETEEPLVVYRALYGVRGMWVRPFDMFMSDVEVDGQRVRRFAPVMDADGDPGRGD
jgi:hypothetical protein